MLRLEGLAFRDMDAYVTNKGISHTGGTGLAKV